MNNALHKNHCKKCYKIFNINGQTIDNPTQVSDHFNDFFINIGPKQASHIADNNIHFSTYLSNPNESSMFFTPITEDEVIEIIKNLDAKKSPGHDHANPNFNNKETS